MKTKIAIYGRVSTDAQSHDSQLREVRSYVERRWPKAEVVEYTDTASGAKFTRKGLDAMMAEVRAGRVNVVTIYKLDRLGRSLQHLAQLLGELEAMGCALIATSQGIDTSDSNPAARLVQNVLSAVAQFDRETIVERVNAGLAAAKARGVKLGRPRKLDALMPDVKRLVEDGLSARKVAQALRIPPGSAFSLCKKVRADMAQQPC